MPHLTFQLSPGGPLLDILIGVSEGRAEALKRASQEVPSLKKVRALIDTGASCSCIDLQIINSLGLTPTGSTSVQTASTGATPHNTDLYDIYLGIPLGSIICTFAITAVVALDLAHQGIDVIIGRDILKTALVIYNGEKGFFTLAY